MYELVLRVNVGSTASADQVDRQVSSLHRDLKAAARIAAAEGETDGTGESGGRPPPTG
ncbi:hypothetical protein [Streptomyces sp. NPDC088719]|uniref:hypothetical protein n=1 Tax=Streptomyces sp. NPDC088719 TaxID=3365872 RepID=UPI00382EE01B